MTKIEMSFTRDELQLLIKLLYTGHVVCEKDGDPEAETSRTHSLVDRFLQGALAYKAMDGIEYDEESGRHFFDADHEEAILEDFNHFVEESFWDELIYRLGIRDFVDAVGEPAITKMDDSERTREEEKYMETYRKEFTQEGIRRIGISR